MGKASSPALPVPARVEDLSREGAIFLLGILGPVIRPADLASARWHELVCDTERAHNAWKAASAAADAAYAKCSINSRTYHRDAIAREAARAKEQRAYRAYRRADDAASAFFAAHVCPPPPTAPAAEEYA